jgi:hypothetical protein
MKTAAGFGRAELSNNVKSITRELYKRINLEYMPV